MNSVNLVTAAIDAVMVEFQRRIDRQVNAQVHALAALLAEADQVVELVPSYRCLLVYYNPLKHSEQQIRELILQAVQQPLTVTPESTLNHLIEVCYHPSLALDSELISTQTGLSSAAQASLHSGEDYCVYTLGFAPGFAYLGDLPPALQLPRLATPRAAVPALSVAIANQQTAIYPHSSPGGWLIIGRALALPQLSAGDRVRFVAISLADYQARAVTQ
ncbi:5-oxoprolinase subunit B family protein [Pseudidiomarina mangrovi]|uniref:5-oxoprolinase subunit B family protein n=1 Tax=Pseudidiomarina mangrovi TaxID=2487133 RepID=UPI000FCA3E6C|nr:allophanate hydrolase subunit 1 [Pseudidiomarina mangrovi]